MQNADEKIEMLFNGYTVHRKGEVTAYIKEHPEIIPYIEKITPIISSHFPDRKKCMTFCEDYEFEEPNDITIYIPSSETRFESDWKKFKEMEIEILKMKEFPRRMNTLISIDLWL
jgi:hypothetical protein